MSQLNHILSKLEEQKKAYVNLKEVWETLTPKYRTIRANTLIERIGYYTYQLTILGKRGLIIKITSATYIKSGEVELLTQYWVYYSGINRREAEILFKHEHPKDTIVEIMEITPGERYSNKSKKYVAM